MDMVNICLVLEKIFENLSIFRNSVHFTINISLLKKMLHTRKGNNWQSSF